VNNDVEQEVRNRMHGIEDSGQRMMGRGKK
jgi:hypothetical protein